MTSNETTGTTNADRTRWWMFWRWAPRAAYRGRRDRLSPEAQGDSANYGMRSGL